MPRPTVPLTRCNHTWPGPEVEDASHYKHRHICGLIGQHDTAGHNPWHRCRINGCEAKHMCNVTHPQQVR